MFKKFIPTYHAKSIYDIDFSIIKEIGIKYILSDLDNTLDAFACKEPTDKVFDLVKKIKSLDLDIIVLSNNDSKRVSKYCSPLGIKYAYLIGKPFKTRLLNYLKNNNIDKTKCIMIGDQLITDVQCANRCKIKSIYTSKLVEKDQWTTKINRILEKYIKHYLNKKGLIKEL